MAVAAMQSADQHIRSSLGILTKDQGHFSMQLKKSSIVHLYLYEMKACPTAPLSVLEDAFKVMQNFCPYTGSPVAHAKSESF